MSDLRKTEEMVREALEDYRPTPSGDFYKQLSSAPWARPTRRVRVWWVMPRLAAALVAFVVLVGGAALVSPTARAFVADLFWWHPVGREAPADESQRRATATDLAAFAGTYDTQGPAADASGLTMILSLKTDGSAQLISDYTGKERIAERGSWKLVSSGRIAVTFTEQTADGTTRVYDVPQREFYELRGSTLFVVSEGSEGSPGASGSGGGAADPGALRFWRR